MEMQNAAQETCAAEDMVGAAGFEPTTFCLHNQLLYLALFHGRLKIAVVTRLF